MLFKIQRLICRCFLLVLRYRRHCDRERSMAGSRNNPIRLSLRDVVEAIQFWCCFVTRAPHSPLDDKPLSSRGTWPRDPATPQGTLNWAWRSRSLANLSYIGISKNPHQDLLPPATIWMIAAKHTSLPQALMAQVIQAPLRPIRHAVWYTVQKNTLIEAINNFYSRISDRRLSASVMVWLSTYSNSPPKGIPRAIRVILIW